MAGLSECLVRTFCLLAILVTGTVQASGGNTSVAPSAAEESYDLTPKESRIGPGDGFNERYFEHILSFDVHARFNTNGSMEMRENIKVLSLGNEIRRGIFRTLPLTWNRQDGKFFSVDYQIKNVLRNGMAEPYSVDKSGKTLTVRIGSADRLLQPGIYNYEIQYQVSNHFSRFPDWDELYWNVTGNGWAYPISNASFHLELPDASAFLDKEGKDTRLRSIDIYTGLTGEKEQNARILSDGGVETTQPLARGEGLTVVYTWPRSILAGAPTPQATSPLVHLLLPTEKTIALWIPIFLLIGYCLLWWRKNVTAIGLKMPPVVPLYAIPDAMTPGYLRYVTCRKYDDVAFSSDLLDLVAKRGVVITTKKGKYDGAWFSKGQSQDGQWLSLQSDRARKGELNDNDKQLLKILFNGNRQSINLGVAHQLPMQKARKWLEKRCADKREQLFIKWGKSLRRAIYIMLLIPLICGVFFNLAMAIVTIPALLLLLLGLMMLSLPLRFLFSPRKVWDSWGCIPLFMSLIFGPLATFGSGAFMFAMLPLVQYPAGYPGALLVGIVVCVIFGWAIPRYTQRGLNDLAVAEGLKLYLGAAEKYRYQALYPPEQRVSHFESLLPVALALGVGKTWANSFAQYLISTGTMSDVFANADWDSVHHFSQSCRSSSMETPSRSSGSSSSSSSSSSGSGSSGGGSSGGGSGGGGGGGW